MGGGRVKRERGLEREVADLRADSERLRARVVELRFEADRARKLDVRVAQLEAEVAKLKAQLEEARRAAKRQAAPHARRLGANSRKRPGRKNGHPPANRPAPDRVDHEVDVPLGGACPDCGEPLEDFDDHEQVVEEIPFVRPEATRYHTHSAWCRRCKKRWRSRHAGQTSDATGAAGVQVGPRALALAADLKHRTGVTYEKIHEVFWTAFGFRVSAAGLYRAIRRLGRACRPTYQALAGELRRADYVATDATGWRIARRHASLWVFATPQGITLYRIPAAGQGGVVRSVLGPDFAGTVGLDGWLGFIKLPYRMAQCVAHLLRRCAELIEIQKRGAARFPRAIKDLLCRALVLKAKQGALSPAYYARRSMALHQELHRLIGGKIADPDNFRFANHLRRWQPEVLAFLRDPSVPPTNNLAEREIRPAVILRKISAGNRSAAGAETHEVLASVIQTAHRCGQNFIDLAPDLMRAKSAAVAPLAVLPQAARTGGPLAQVPPTRRVRPGGGRRGPRHRRLGPALRQPNARRVHRAPQRHRGPRGGRRRRARGRPPSR